MNPESKVVKVVVASPGMQAFVEIAGQRLVIDCYTPVDLTQKFSEKEIASSMGLAENLRQEFLVEYTGQALPINPNAHVIVELRQNQSQHIQVNYTQKGSIENPGTQFVTDPEQITDEFKQNLMNGVEQSRAKILSEGATLVNKVDGAYTDIDRDPVERKHALTSEELIMKVSMDVTPSQFIEAQKASAAKANAARSAIAPIQVAKTSTDEVKDDKN